MHYNSLLKPAMSTLVYSLLAAGSISAAYATPPNVVISYVVGDRGGKPTTADAASVVFGNNVTLDLRKTYDSEGNRVGYKLWSLVSKPSGSTLAIDSKQQNLYDLKLSPDKKGVYKVRLIVRDRNHEQAEKTFTLTVTNATPTLTAIASNYTTLKYSPTIINPRGALDIDGDALTYSWTINSKPVGSTVAQGPLNGSFLQFKPDRAGDYQITVTAHDSESSVSKNLTVKALRRTPTNSKLDLPPGPVRYSSYINRVVVKPDYLPMIYLVNPDSMQVEQVDLPRANAQQATRNSLVLSNNGRYAAFSYNTGLQNSTKDSYDQKVSVMDLSTRSIIRTVTLQTALDKDYLALSNTGILYALQYEPFAVRQNPTRIRLETRNIPANTPSVLTSVAVLSDTQDIRSSEVRLNVADNRKQLFLTGTQSTLDSSGENIKKRIFNFNFDLNALGEPLFPTTNFQSKERTGDFGTEYDPVAYCYNVVGFSKDNGKIYTGYNFFYRPFSFDTERYISYFPANASDNCITNVFESLTGNQSVIVQNNYDYTILDGQTVTEQGNLTTRYGVGGGARVSAFYTTDNKVLFHSTSPNSFLIKHH